MSHLSCNYSWWQYRYGDFLWYSIFLKCYLTSKLNVLFTFLNKFVSSFCFICTLGKTIQYSYYHYCIERTSLSHQCYEGWHMKWKQECHIFTLLMGLDAEGMLFSNYVDCVLWKEMLNRMSSNKVALAINV